MDDKQYTFTLEDIFFPLITSVFSNKTKEGKNNVINIAYKIIVEIVSSKKTEVLFGIQATLGNSKDKNKSTVVVETLGIFNFSNEVFKNKITSTDSIKALPNMLAILLPFIREKIYTCFYNNKIIFYLPSINTFKLVEDLKNKIKFVDKRSSPN